LLKIEAIDGCFLCPGFAGTRRASQEFVERRKGRVIAFQCTEGARLNPPGIGFLWVELRGDTARLKRFLKLIELQQVICLVSPRDCKFRLKSKRLLIAGERLFGSFETSESCTYVIPCPGIARIERDGLIGCVDTFFVAAQVEQRLRFLIPCLNIFWSTE